MGYSLPSKSHKMLAKWNRIPLFGTIVLFYVTATKDIIAVQGHSYGAAFKVPDPPRETVPTFPHHLPSHHRLLIKPTAISRILTTTQDLLWLVRLFFTERERVSRCCGSGNDTLEDVKPGGTKRSEMMEQPPSKR